MDAAEARRLPLFGEPSTRSAREAPAPALATGMMEGGL